MKVNYRKLNSLDDIYPAISVCTQVKCYSQDSESEQVTMG